jgi:hypothetical protein
VVASVSARPACVVRDRPIATSAYCRVLRRSLASAPSYWAQLKLTRSFMRNLPRISSTARPSGYDYRVTLEEVSVRPVLGRKAAR